MVGYVNSIPRGQRIDYEYHDGKLPMAETPALEDKGPLMIQTFAAVRNILADEALDDRRALRKAGLTLAGAVNYIHPFEDGNGRTGRIMHYLMENGTERGEEAFGEELYAIIAKVPVYDSDTHSHAFYNTPPPELERTLSKVAAENMGDAYYELSGRERASAKVLAFLDVMQGSALAPMQESIKIKIEDNGGFKPAVDENGNNIFKNMDVYHTYEAGEIDVVSYYEQQFLELSEIPNRSPGDVPQGSKRVLTERQSAAANDFQQIAAGLVNDFV